MCRPFGFPIWKTLATCLLSISAAPGLTVLGQSNESRSSSQALFGFSKLDITPSEPIRLSGYGSRKTPSEGVDSQLYVRSMVMKLGATGNAESTQHRILVSVDSIGFPAVVTNKVVRRISERYGIARSEIVLTFTHNHTAPHIAGGLRNLFDTPTSVEDQTRIDEYTEWVQDQTFASVSKAFEDLRPGKLLHTEGTVTFARNRRVLGATGVWTGFGVQADGPVDHSLSVLRVVGADDETRGVVFNYACHCTTFGGQDNRVNSEWAGYATSYVEQALDCPVAICTIGCGADANPSHERESKMEDATAHGAEIRDEVRRLVDEAAWQEVTLSPNHCSASFGFAGLPVQRPELTDLRTELDNRRYQVRRHAEEMLATYERMGRLPESYPMPIQVWRFAAKDRQANDLVMIFLGGEVCVDYALRTKAELASQSESWNLSDSLDESNLWITAYANDVFGYVAPERMQAEGGYEVDFSMIYYLQPGRWASGTEALIMRRIHELVGQNKNAADSLQTFEVADGLQLRLLASEPVVRDPINLSVDATGRVWVVEMGDYPSGDSRSKVAGTVFPNARAFRGKNEKPWDGEPGGRIKLLHDRDGDGVFEDATVFLDGLKFPTGVFPWEDGLIVCAAPDIFFAKDTDGDGRCDAQEVLFTGFAEANPQHRVNGFEWGLDGWLYLAAGNHDNGEIHSIKTGETISTSGRDIRIDPVSGGMEAISGASQWIRCRDDFGNWFGNDNTRPLFQFPVQQRYFRRNPWVASPSSRVDLTNPPRSPQVFPSSRTEDRFNDLHTLNRFTSACGPLIYKSSEESTEALICEPVHNLISRLVLDRESIVFSAERIPDEATKEFLTSTDNWFRPVRILTAPNDDEVWICDMYRQVIEHPEWIPEAWQTSLDLYAGSRQGRIYALRNGEGAATKTANLAALDGAALVQQLSSPKRWVRDTAQRLLLERFRAGNLETELDDVVESLLRVIEELDQPLATRIQVLWTLKAISPEKIDSSAWFRWDSPDFLTNLLATAGLASIVNDHELVRKLVAHPSPRVRFALTLALGDLPVEQRLHFRNAFVEIALASQDDPWMRSALLSSISDMVDEFLITARTEYKLQDLGPEILAGAISTKLKDEPKANLDGLLVSLGYETPEDMLAHPEMSDFIFSSLAKRGISFQQLAASASADSTMRGLADQLNSKAALWLELEDRSATDRQQLWWLGFATANEDEIAEALTDFLDAHHEADTQRSAIESLVQLGRIDPLLNRFPALGMRSQTQVELALLSRQKWTEAWLDAIAAQELDPNLVSPSARQAIQTHRAADIRNRYADLFLAESDPQRQAVIAQYRAAMAKLEPSNEPGAGAQVFQKHCAACHQVGGVGNNFGPDLAALVGKDSDYLLMAILDPNRAVESKYRAYSVLTANDRIWTGMMLEESATSIKLALSDGKTISILREDIEELKSVGKSPMPEGFERSINPPQMHDLLAFLELARTSK